MSEYIGHVQLDSSDYLEYMQPAADSDLARLSRLADLQANAARRVDVLSEELEAARRTLRDIADRQIPELMDAVGLAEFKTSTGAKISVRETIRASIPEANRIKAFAWLRENGQAALIKRTVAVQFGKGEFEKAQDLSMELTSRGLAAEDKVSVHPQTLAAYVREALKKGAELPLDLLGVHRSRSAEVSQT